MYNFKYYFIDVKRMGMSFDNGRYEYIRLVRCYVSAAWGDYMYNFGKIDTSQTLRMIRIDYGKRGRMQVIQSRMNNIDLVFSKTAYTINYHIDDIFKFGESCSNYEIKLIGK